LQGRGTDSRLALQRINSRCLSRAVLARRLVRARRCERTLGVAWLGPEPPRSSARREPLDQRALPLLKTGRVALQRRDCCRLPLVEVPGVSGASLFSDAIVGCDRGRVVRSQPARRRRYHVCGGWVKRVFGATTLGGTTRPPNKGMKLTKPSILELRSLSLVFAALSMRVGGPRTPTECAHYSRQRPKHQAR
jgi:hypothetical protein